MTRDELEEHIADISWRKHGNDGMEEIMALVDAYTEARYRQGRADGIYADNHTYRRDRPCTRAHVNRYP